MRPMPEDYMAQETSNKPISRPQPTNETKTSVSFYFKVRILNSHLIIKILQLLLSKQQHHQRRINKQFRNNLKNYSKKKIFRKQAKLIVKYIILYFRNTRERL